MKKYHGIFNIIICLGLILLIGSCREEGDSDTQSSNNGSLPVSIAWHNSYPPEDESNSASLDSLVVTPVGVETVRISVSATDMNIVSQSFPYEAGHGSITGIPVGDDRTVTCDGLNASGTVTYRGVETGITITANENTPVQIETYWVEYGTLLVCKSGCEYSTIQSAIDDANPGYTVLVDDGVYYENINFNGLAITVQSVNGAANAIIDGSLGSSVVTFTNSETNSSILSGFTITGGTGTVSGSNPIGGGIYCYSSSPKINNCTISGNTAIGESNGWGGGIYCSYSSSPTIINCTISSNIATSSGGGIYAGGSSSPTITNCTISGNSAIWGGGIICHDNSPTITNCTISYNTASNDGGGIYCYSASPTVVNIILWGDTAGVSGNEIYLDGDNSIDITYSDIQQDSGIYTGTGNINAAPQFNGGGDYHLTSGSPCIDSGTSSGAPSDDIDGDNRPYGAGFDMGSDEYIGCPDDHGNTTATATSVDTDCTPVSGSIECEADWDFFSFYAFSEDSFIIETGGSMDTYIYLINTDGITIIDQDDDGGEGLLSHIEWVCQDSGTYYVKVKHYSSAETGSYTLSVCK